jgi:hypothetical protein
MNHTQKYTNYASGLLFGLSGGIMILTYGLSFVAFAFIFVGVATVLIGELKAARDDIPLDWELYKRPVFYLSATLFLIASMICAGMEVYMNDEMVYWLVRLFK